MRSSEAPSSATPRRLGTRLLLALALCACGEGGGGADQPRADDAGGQAALAATAAPPDSCLPPPPPIRPAAGTPWADLVRQISDAGLTFPDSAGNNSIHPVKLCEECDTISLQLRATNRTCGLDSLQARQAVRPLGLIIPQRDVPVQPGWGDIRQGDTIFLFAPAGLEGNAQLAYRQKNPATQVDTVALAPEGSWLFFFCRESHPPAGRSAWRPRDVLTRGQGPGDDDDDDDDDNDGGGSYGWMACISGCCQFYTPPGTIQTPTQASEKAPNEVGPGLNQGQGAGRPQWCKGT